MAANITPQNVEKMLNLGDTSYAPLQLGSQIIRRGQRIAKGVYDFSLLGGAIGTINLIDPAYASNAQPKLLGKAAQQALMLPPSAIVVRVLIDVITACTGSGASIALSTGVSAGDIKTATGVGSFGVGLIDGSPVHTAASAIKVPVATAQPGVTPSMTISGAALTAGKFNVHIEYYLSD